MDKQLWLKGEFEIFTGDEKTFLTTCSFEKLEWNGSVFEGVLNCFVFEGFGYSTLVSADTFYLCRKIGSMDYIFDEDEVCIILSNCTCLGCTLLDIPNQSPAGESLVELKLDLVGKIEFPRWK